MSETLPRKYTIPEVAKMFNVTPNAVRLWCRNGLIQAHKAENHRWYINKDAILAFAKSFPELEEK
jgi:DNA-binding transcriptional MerR regulator